MAETELKVILEAKDLAEHTLRVASNCNRYPKYNTWKNHAMHGNCIKLCHSMDLYVKELLKSEE